MFRDFQIIVWGSTGYTGQLVTEYLHQNYKNNIRWAIAGRNIDKLQTIKQNLQLAETVECLVGDSFDVVSLQEITVRTEVMISTVGPYALYGKALVGACVETKTDYCDLTGELPFFKESIDSFHKQAKTNKVKIVHSCGYDSIPSDIGCLLLQEKAIEKFGAPLANVKLFVLAIKGKFSGGTTASMSNLIKDGKDKGKRFIQTNPYVLCADSTKTMPYQRIQNFVWYDHRIERFTAPFIMARFNSRVVFRTNDLLRYKYGRNFMYDEGLVVGRGISGRLYGSLLTLGIGLFITFMSVSITRKFIHNWLLPKPGEGPTREERDNGYFKVLIIGEDEELERRLEVSISDNNDPGYGSTSKMIVEVALCLALDKNKIPQHFGVITPAVALGKVIVERLKKADFHIRVTD